MKVINLEQNTDAWLDWRRSGLGSSDIASICGVNPYQSALDIYNTKTGFSEEQEPNVFMMRGKKYETEAREMFESIHGKSYPAINIEHDEFGYFKASLDGFCTFNRYIVEIKCSSGKVFSSRVPFVEDQSISFRNIKIVKP